MSTLTHEDMLLQIFDEVQEAFPYYDEEWTDVRGWLTKSEVWSWLRIVSEY